VTATRRRRPPTRQSKAEQASRTGFNLAAVEQIRALLSIASMLLDCSTSSTRTTTLERAYELSATRILELKQVVENINTLRRQSGA
jgi:hypothetical protein